MLQLWLTILFAVLTKLAALIALTVMPAVFVKFIQRARLIRLCRGKLVLSYDDGPGPELTPLLMDLLRRHGVKASFFLVGFRATKYPEMCNVIREAGHEIGCHTDQHLDAWRIWPWTAVRDVVQGFRALSEWLKPNAPFRPPFGKLTTWTWLTARRYAAPMAWWTFDGLDTMPVLPERNLVIERFIQSGGGVVLLHSHDRGEDRQAYVLALTEQLIKAARTHQLQICTFSELLEEPHLAVTTGEGYVREA